MSHKNNLTVLILGGAGFIGSNIVQKFCAEGYNVIVIDGLLNQTGGKRDNLKQVISNIQFIESKIEDAPHLDKIIQKTNLIIDCMAWTSHHLAVDDPVYDLKLNTESHLYFIRHLKKLPDRKVIYLGSRSQYGNPDTDEITEDTPMLPIDIQGIHKLASESYLRVYSRLYGLNVISIRFPNCFGKNQPVKGKDIGLIGSFIRGIMENRVIEIFQSNRSRSIAYVKDLSDLVFMLSAKSFAGFNAFNYCGQEILIENLVKIIIEIAGKGEYQIREMPDEIKAIDIGNKRCNDEKLRLFLHAIPQTDLNTALAATISYFKEQINDL